MNTADSTKLAAISSQDFNLPDRWPNWASACPESGRRRGRARSPRNPPMVLAGGRGEGNPATAPCGGCRRAGSAKPSERVRRLRPPRSPAEWKRGEPARSRSWASGGWRLRPGRLLTTPRLPPALAPRRVDHSRPASPSGEEREPDPGIAARASPARPGRAARGPCPAPVGLHVPLPPSTPGAGRRSVGTGPQLLPAWREPLENDEA